MKIFMLADGEGATGIVSYERQSHPGAFHYAETRANLMSDINSAVAGAVAGGATEVIIYDMHCWGLNININELNSCAKVVMGKPRLVPPQTRLDRSINGLMMIGLHTKAETPGGLLTHTYTLDIKDLTINGLSVGEIGMEAALAGEFGVPLIFLSGDAMCLPEARVFSKNVEFVSVKEPVTDLAALCLPTNITSTLIREAAERAVRNIADFDPFEIAHPVIVETEYHDEQKAQEKLQLPGVRAINSKRVSVEAKTLCEAWIRLKPE